MASFSQQDIKDYLTKWRQRLHPILDDLDRTQLFIAASGLAYTTLLSLIPFLAIVFTLTTVFIPLFQLDDVFFDKMKNWIITYLASGTGDKVIDSINAMLERVNFGRLGVTGLVGLFVSTILILRQIELVLNKIWFVKEERNPIKRFISFWTILTLGGTTIAVILVFFSTQKIAAFMGYEYFTFLFQLLQESLPFLCLVIFYTSVFKVVPNTDVYFKSAGIAGLTCAVVSVLLATGYGKFTESFTKYEVIYGALAAVPVFLMWLYLNWLVILFGALFSMRLQKGYEYLEGSEDTLFTYPLVELVYHAICRAYDDSQKVDFPYLQKKFHIHHDLLENALNLLNKNRFIVIDAESQEMIVDPRTDRQQFTSFMAQLEEQQKALLKNDRL